MMHHIAPFVLTLLLLVSASAQLPSDTLSVSGLLKDSGGLAITGSADLEFRIYTVATGGAPVWTESHAAVPLTTSGRYHVKLGSFVPLAAGLFATADRWLGVEANGDGEMTPRLALSTAPYSHNSNLLDGLPAPTFAPRAELNDGSTATTPVGWNDITGAPIDPDPDPSNELNISLALNGTDLELTDGGGTLVADLSTLGGGGGGDTRTLSFPDGFTGMVGVTRNVLSTNPYTVPAGKNFYITNICGAGSTASLLIGSITVSTGMSNQGGNAMEHHIEMPFIAGAGEVVSTAADGKAVGGILVDASVTPITRAGLLSSPFTVPAGQQLVITNVHILDASADFTIDGMIFQRAYANHGSSNRNQRTGLPLVLEPGQVVASTLIDTVAFNGYLLSGGLGGGGGGGGSGGSLTFPDGLSPITPITIGNLQTAPYTPPAGTTLYVTSYRCTSSGANLQINGRYVFDGNSNFGSATGWNQHLEQPFLVGDADTLSSSSNNPVINGFLIDAGVTPVTLGNLQSTPYTVPAGLILVVLNYRCTSSGANLQIGGRYIFDGNSNFGSATSWNQRLGAPILVGEGEILSSSSNNSVVNGYLRGP